VPGPTNLQTYLQSDERSDRIKLGLQTHQIRSSDVVKNWEASWKELNEAERQIVDNNHAS